MRWLSMSVVFKQHNSARRMPVEYSVMRIVWWKGYRRADQQRYLIRGAAPIKRRCIRRCRKRPSLAPSDSCDNSGNGIGAEKPPHKKVNRRQTAPHTRFKRRRAACFLSDHYTVLTTVSCLLKVLRVAADCQDPKPKRHHVDNPDLPR